MFGSVAITDKSVEITTASVAFHGNSIAKVGMTGNTLSFKFTISLDMWKNDLFEITVPS